jgi:hypothetical protein
MTKPPKENCAHELTITQGFTLLIIESKILGVDQRKGFGWWRLGCQISTGGLYLYLDLGF